MRQLARLELVTRKVFRGRMKGERRSARKGQSVEFADYRNYVSGDDLRTLDWNLYARLDKLIVKLFLEEEDLHFYTLIDASPSMAFGEPTKLDYAKRLAAALGYVSTIKGDRLRIETLGGRRSPVLRGRKSVPRMLDFLDGVEADENVSLAEGVRKFCLRNSGRGVVVLISDLMDKSGYEAALRYLVAQRVDVYVLQLLSQEEIDPGVTGDLRLVDCEDDDTAEITVSAPLLARYKRTLDAFTGGVQDFCSKRGMNYVLASNETPVSEMMTSYLRRRGLVR
ncbi:hypothetical protein Mal64_18220 [Pseudobythopirellula maris]|uniref:DUF58 domain-containing protein n=1 Tax=Pseudobythopirellula maris TaxID=2527991 RepID=A0A5C5ZPN3_9BACT|nr:DUF58 domain-containing protein [Pseudobythopirellula maris]TWT88343.1 hypothetical protein Mal64_18220 [Pseudobythopirellula maris]